MKNTVLACLSLAVILQFSASPAHALALFGTEAKTSIKDLKLAETAKIDDATPEIPRVTEGLRQKKVVFAWFSVYVAQIFSNEKKLDFSLADKLEESLSLNLPLIVSMTFLRDVGIDKIVDGFKEGFKENKIDTRKPPYSDFIAAIKDSGDVKDRQTYFFVFSRDVDKRTLSVQTNKKEIFVVKDQPQAVIESFLNLWLGKPSDSGLEQLQDQLLKHKL